MLQHEVNNARHVRPPPLAALRWELQRYNEKKMAEGRAAEER